MMHGDENLNETLYEHLLKEVERFHALPPLPDQGGLWRMTGDWLNECIRLDTPSGYPVVVLTQNFEYWLLGYEIEVCPGDSIVPELWQVFKP